MNSDFPWNIILPIFVHECTLSPLDIFSLSLCCTSFRDDLHKRGVAFRPDDVINGGVIWKTMVWTSVLSMCTYTGRMRYDTIICIPEDMCRYCGQSKASRCIMGWWIDDSPPNDVTLRRLQVSTAIDENTLLMEWPAFVHDCVHGGGLDVKQVESAILPICPACFACFCNNYDKDRRHYYPPRHIVLGRHFYYSFYFANLGSSMLFTRATDEEALKIQASM